MLLLDIFINLSYILFSISNNSVLLYFIKFSYGNKDIIILSHVCGIIIISLVFNIFVFIVFIQLYI